LIISQFENKVLSLIHVEGEEAISKVCEIKHSTRRRYISTYILNCLHSPSDQQEYNDHIRLLVDGINDNAESDGIMSIETINDLSHIKGISKFLKFSEMCSEDYIKCAKEMIDSNYSFAQPYERKLNEEKYLLFLHRHNIYRHHNLYIAAAIYEYIPDIKLSEAYMLHGTATTKGKTLLMSSNNENEVYKSYKALYAEGLGVSFTHR